ncbi:MAG: hypothetical protein R6U38_10955 [Desulfatiglandaceae bacterium]
MKSKNNLHEMDAKIQTLKKAAQELKDSSDDFPAVFRNCSRILASIKMLEINVSDLIQENRG